MGYEFFKADKGRKTKGRRTKDVRLKTIMNYELIRLSP